MARVNTKSTKTVRNVPVEEITSNYEGAVAYKYSDTDRLIERTVGAFWNEKLYYAPKGTGSDLIKDVLTVSKKDPKFVLQLAAYARNVLNLRTTPQVLLVEAANNEACKPFVREYAPKIVKRADELSDVIAYQLSTHGKPIPNSLKKGLAAAFSNFDEYQLNKYDSDKRAVKLGDVLRLIERHENYPVSKAMYNYLVHDELDEEALPLISAYKKLMAKSELDDEALELVNVSSVTWEAFISKFGSTKANWELVIPNMGYMALLRNLRNFEEKGVNLDPVLEIIADPKRVRASKQLPFRFYSAYKNTSNQKIRRAIAKAFEASIDNVELDGKTGVLVDLSGSMGAHISDKSDITYAEAGAVIAAMAVKKASESVIVGFATSAKEFKLNPDDSMITNVEKILQGGRSLGGGTDAYQGFSVLANSHKDLNRIILISDMQCYGGRNGMHIPRLSYSWGNSDVTQGWQDYVAKNRKAHLYSWDISAYGSSQVPSTEQAATKLFGWSDKILDYIVLSEKKASLDPEIRKW